MRNSGKLEVLIPRSLCEIEKTNNLKVDDENLASVFVAWEKGTVSELRPTSIDNKKPKKILSRDLSKLMPISINLSLLENFQILNQTIKKHF